jgi:hypothetical protein
MNGISPLIHAIRAASSAAAVWCVFDNTASGAAIENAWELNELLGLVTPSDSA